MSVILSFWGSKTEPMTDSYLVAVKETVYHYRGFFELITEFEPPDE